MIISGWGNYPKIAATIHKPKFKNELLHLLYDNDDDKELIARGMGRSYGDSSLAKNTIVTENLDHYIEFDASNGILTCYAGVTLDDILTNFVPRGWFLPVTPGTKHISVGGAIASDVHGKNHHLDGTFSEHVLSFEIATVNKGVITCSRSDNADLFSASCGGMGLTGIILSVKLKLRAITSSFIHETTIKAKNIHEAIDIFEENNHSTYSVAWIDCLSRGDSLGRSLVMLGEHEADGELIAHKSNKINIPQKTPGFLLSNHTIKAFNTIYYNTSTSKNKSSTKHYDNFFYPLDMIENWNRLYGVNGFIQYQFVLPYDTGKDGLIKILERISSSKLGSFLAVLKKFGMSNNNPLSFPILGYTIALDFKLTKQSLELANELDKIVLKYNGKIYLTKDARMSEHTFKKCYPEWEKFMAIREKYGADKLFHSLQSDRIGLRNR